MIPQIGNPCAANQEGMMVKAIYPTYRHFPKDLNPLFQLSPWEEKESIVRGGKSSGAVAKDSFFSISPKRGKKSQ
jgi:hypothetical protein